MMFTAASISLCLAIPGSAREDGYQLDVGDELRLSVAEHPELSGTFAINSEGSIGIPLLDGLRVAGMSIDDARSSIRTKIGSRVHNIVLSLEVARHRPFYILGEVQRPGAYPWTPGLTAEVAVALAGGYRSRSESFAAAVTGVRAAESRANATRDFVNAWVERARLRAELDEAPAFTFTGAPPLPAQADRLREAADRQKELFEARKLGFSDRMQLLRKELSIRDNEIASLEARSAAQQRLAEQLKTELRSVQDYVSRGLTPTSRLSELNREDNRLQSDVLQTSALMNQARQARNQTELQLASVIRDRRVQILSALDETTARIERLNRQLQADVAVMVEANSALGLADVPTTFQIRSKADGGVHSTTQEWTRVEPGDVVTVRLLPRESDSQSAGRRTAQRSAGE